MQAVVQKLFCIMKMLIELHEVAILRNAEVTINYSVKNTEVTFNYSVKIYRQFHWDFPYWVPYIGWLPCSGDY